MIACNADIAGVGIINEEHQFLLSFTKATTKKELAAAGGRTVVVLGGQASLYIFCNFLIICVVPPNTRRSPLLARKSFFSLAPFFARKSFFSLAPSLQKILVQEFMGEVYAVRRELFFGRGPLFWLIHQKSRHRCPTNAAIWACPLRERS